MGVPQLWLNYSRKHTRGLAVSLIAIWLFGDIYKVSYYEHTSSPPQLVICAFFSCMVDCAILGQFWVYRKLTAYESAKSSSAGSEADSESIAITTISASDNKGAGLSNIEMTLETREYSSPTVGE